MKASCRIFFVKTRDRDTGASAFGGTFEAQQVLAKHDEN
ncbi:MAG: hypothetical protein Ct9H300mP16_17680 [Pseudomonadota bacterium]|nr:MAG: hypothetical protein Ct9H300mP16_17680 [Pseudomonadota bacterium]